MASNVSIAASVECAGGRARRISARTTGARGPGCGSGPGRAGQRRSRPRPDDRVLRVPGKVGVIEVGEVVVEDPRIGRLAGDDVPDRLIEASGDQIPARQVHARRPGQHLGQRAVTAQSRPEMRQLLLDRKLPGPHAGFLPPWADAARLPPTETPAPGRRDMRRAVQPQRHDRAEVVADEARQHSGCADDVAGEAHRRLVALTAGRGSSVPGRCCLGAHVSQLAPCRGPADPRGQLR